jgi:hypothetical protein
LTWGFQFFGHDPSRRFAGRGPRRCWSLRRLLVRLFGGICLVRSFGLNASALDLRASSPALHISTATHHHSLDRITHNKLKNYIFNLVLLSAVNQLFPFLQLETFLVLCL